MNTGRKTWDPSAAILWQTGLLIFLQPLKWFEKINGNHGNRVTYKAAEISYKSG